MTTPVVCCAGHPAVVATALTLINERVQPGRHFVAYAVTTLVVLSHAGK